MKSSLATFLLGALAGAAIALGVRAAILDMDDGGASSHGAHAGQTAPTMPTGHEGHDSGMEMPKPSAEPEPKGLLLDLGNEKCPIMGNAVNGKTWSEWNGLRVGHCCPPCIPKFLAEPEKTLEAAGIEWKEAADLVTALESSTGEKRKRLLAEADEKFGVVRRPEDRR